MHYDRLALLLNDTFSMEMLTTLLKERFAKDPDAIIEGDSTDVTLRCDTWTAHFEMDNEPHVAEECQELAADHDQSARAFPQNRMRDEILDIEM